ncbi:MAG: Gfo/Idh/MocA family oxidoreductase [bacterium]
MNENRNDNELCRRRFLSSAAVLGGAYALGRSVPAQNTQDDIHLALIGCGSQGQALLNTCMKIPGVRFMALCDIWETYNLNRASQILHQFKQEHATYTDYREMLDKEKDLDAVIVATPDFCHAEQTIACLQAGLNVYCESMMSNTLDGARAMANAANESGKLLQIGYQRRSNLQYRHAYEHIINETTLLGTLTAANAQWNRAIQPERGWPKRAPIDNAVLTAHGYESMQQFRNWDWYKKLGSGPLGSLGSHQIDIFNWFLESPPVTVMASGGTDYYNRETHEWNDTVMAVLEYQLPKNPVRVFYQTLNSNSNFGYFEDFMGDEGTLYVSEVPGRVKVYREPAAPDWDKWVRLGILQAPVKKEEPKKAEGILDVQETVIPPSYTLQVKSDEPTYKPHLENFFNAIRGLAQLNCPPEAAFQTTVTTLKICAAIESANKLQCAEQEFAI